MDYLKDSNDNLDNELESDADHNDKYLNNLAVKDFNY